MTRFLCTGDLHLGAGTDYGNQPGDRLKDQRATLNVIVDTAILQEVDAVLFAGDAFDGPTVAPEHYSAFQEPLRDLRLAGIPFIAITGNGRHDCAMRDVKAPEVVADVAEIYTHPSTRIVGDTAICMLPWTPVGRLVAAAGGGDRDDINQVAAELLLQTARDMRDAVSSKWKVLMLHWSIEGAALPNGLAIDSDRVREPILPLFDLEGLGFDAIVGGHIHRQQFLGSMAPADEEMPIFYVGSPMPLNFGEGHFTHGISILELAGFYPTVEFVPIDSRPFVTIDCDLTTGAHEQLGLDETDAVAAAIAGYLPIDDAVVRIRYAASDEQARRIDWPKLRGILAPAHKVYAITGDISRSERVRVAGVDEDLAPLAALDLWIEASDVNGHRGPLVDLATRYLEEVGP